MRTRSLITALLLTASAAAFAAEARVSNRAPKPGEIGYRPAEGSLSRLNPPSWIWLHEREAQTYTVQWSPRADFAGAAAAAGVPWNTYTHSQPLAPGTYHWRYRFTTRDGQVSNWSAARRVQVPADAEAFPMPTRAEQRERLPKDHPRLFMRPEDLPRLRELARGRERGRFERLRREADRIMAREPTPEPTRRGSARDKTDKEAVKYWWPNREQTEKACGEAEILAFVYLLTGEPEYGEAARKWVLHLAAWDPDGPTNFTLNCEAAKPLLYRLPRAYDWAYGALTQADRARVQAAMRRRAADAWESGEVRRGVGHLNSPYSSHGNRVWHKLAECAIALYGDVPEAETWLDYAVNKFYAAYPVWSDDDGGWHEGVAYWAGYMGKVTTWLEVARHALRIDGFKKPFFAQVGDFPMYVAPPGSPNSGFGDQSYRQVSPSWGPFLRYFLRAGGSDRAPYWQWWAEQWKMSEERGVIGFLHAAQLPPVPAAKPPADLPHSKVFYGTGIASLHTTLQSANDDVHFLFKSSPFGTQSHGHNPHNSFQLNAYGESLLTTCVYRDLHGSKFHYNWAHATVAHNALLVDGEGQIKHTAAPHGRIATWMLTPTWDYVTGEATDAYGGRLRRYRRHVLFVKDPPAIVLYDDVAAKAPSTYQFMLHGQKQFTVDETTGMLSLELPKAGITARYLPPAPLRFRQWEGYDPAPEFRDFPTQWHVEAGTTAKQAEIRMLTVLVPHRAGQRAAWSAERLESESAVGVRLTRAGKHTVVAFRKDGQQGQATLGGSSFNEAVLVR